MAETLPGLIPELGKRLDALIAVWSTRNEVKALRLAQSLGFWPDGMLEQLQLIAKGEGTPEIFANLERQFDETREPVERLIKEMGDIRGKIIGHKDSTIIINQINMIMYDRELGKNRVRERIEYIIKNQNSELIHQEALTTCNEIDGMNAAIRRLERIVHSS